MSTDMLLKQHEPLALPDASFRDLFPRVGMDERDDGTYTWARLYGPSLKLPLRLRVYPSNEVHAICNDKLWPGMYGLEFRCHRLQSGWILITAAHDHHYTKSIGLTLLTEAEVREMTQC